MSSSDFTIASLGPQKVPSPLAFSSVAGDSVANYVTEEEYLRFGVSVRVSQDPKGEPFAESVPVLLQKAGPRQNLYFMPSHVHAGIVTCGGLCPGLNDVIRAIVRCLWSRYGVRRISGIQFGYKGLLPEYGLSVRQLDPERVDDIHKIGGTILGSSRGGGDRTADLVDSIELLNLNVLFAIGGDGTLKGAMAIAEEIEKRKLKIAVVGIPKTIDNDVLFIDRSFGFETAVEKAVESVGAAHAEAHSAINGIGMVKLMGRESGFIAVHTALAVHEANFLLIPEVPFDLEGTNGFFAHLESRLLARKHAVIVVAEGAGQELLLADAGCDASGNKKLADIGLFLKDRIKEYFAGRSMEVNLKYIDPSYIIRSAPACPTDSVLCERLGNNAVHAALAGKTQLIIGVVNGEFVHIPIRECVLHRRHVDPEGSLYRDAIDAVGQVPRMKN